MSACLLGEKVRYDGGDCRQQGLLDQWRHEGRIIPFCPEVAGGLPVPRPAAEIEHGNAEAALSGKVAVRREDGADVSAAFIVGAEKALAICRKHKISIAVLKEGSPSCGVKLVYDGTFSATVIAGQGLATRLLARHGIAVFSEHQLIAAAKKLVALEGAHG